MGGGGSRVKGSVKGVEEWGYTISLKNLGMIESRGGSSSLLFGGGDFGT